MNKGVNMLKKLVSETNILPTDRDIKIIDFNEDYYLIISCDVSGGIGPNSSDQVQTSGKIVGNFTTRVALMENLAVGAKPLSVANNLTISYEQGGKEILKGIKKQVKEIGLSEEMITGSTEDNINTCETGVGITVTGLVKRDKLRMAYTEEDDLIISLGLPFVGREVLENKNNIVDLKDLFTLLESGLVHDIIPVGSKGIKYEAELIAKESGLQFQERKEALKSINLTVSAGPATVLLATLNKGNLAKIKKLIPDKPINVIGKTID